MCTPIRPPEDDMNSRVKRGLGPRCLQNQAFHQDITMFRIRLGVQNSEHLTGGIQFAWNSGHRLIQGQAWMEHIVRWKRLEQI